MGSSSWSNDTYEDRQRVRAATKAPVFKHHEDVIAGKASGLHESLDPRKMKNGVRESRDSAEHPHSRTVITGLDETGSMADVPRVIQSKLGKLMSTLLTKGIIVDPQILFAAIGDAHTGSDRDPRTREQAPLQVGQFESGLEMEDDLTKFFLEGNGGGQNKESYNLLLYFAVHHVKSDSWEKRKEKGYLFITGDEHNYPVLDGATIHRIFGGEKGDKDFTIAQLVKDAQERYHVFFIIPGGANNASDPALHAHWAGLLGADHVIRLSDANQIVDVMALTIGITEGTATGSITETASREVKAAMDPVIAGAKAKVDKAKAAGTKTARL
jgi:hypothetical protein